MHAAAAAIIIITASAFPGDSVTIETGTTGSRGRAERRAVISILLLLHVGRHEVSRGSRTPRVAAAAAHFSFAVPPMNDLDELHVVCRVVSFCVVIEVNELLENYDIFLREIELSKQIKQGGDNQIIVYTCKLLQKIPKILGIVNKL